MSEDDKTGILHSLLSRAGVSSGLVHKVRFRGPVGKLALVGITGALALGSVGMRTSSSTVAGLCAALATVVILFVVGGILWYSDKHPDQATLEGMEVVIMQQQKIWAEAAAKGIPAIPSGLTTIPNPFSDSNKEIE